MAPLLTEKRQAPVLAPIALPAGGRGVATVNLTQGCAHSSIIRGGPEKPDIIKKIKNNQKSMVLVIDNYDSFVYNLAQYLGGLGYEPRVFRNDKITLAEIEALSPSHIVISPGPGTPEKDAGISNAVIEHFAGKVPILGVCLGHQCIGHVFGGRVVRASRLLHGKTSLIHHDGKTIYQGLPNPFEAGRYHSLLVEPQSLPQELEVSARTEEGEIMGVRHRQYGVEGVQFHPESVLTPLGRQLLTSFLRLVPARWQDV